jgi:hypothetical protein
MLNPYSQRPNEGCWLSLILYVDQSEEGRSASKGGRDLGGLTQRALILSAREERMDTEKFAHQSVNTYICVYSYGLWGGGKVLDRLFISPPIPQCFEV